MLQDEVNKMDFEIKIWFFEIIKEVQYIEKNLANAIATTSFINSETKTIADLEKASDVVLKNIQNKTLGQIIAYAQDYEVFSDIRKYRVLQEILAFRNNLVHAYFKENNYDMQKENLNRDFFVLELSKLKKESDKINIFNNYLCLLCKKKRSEVINIIKKSNKKEVAR